MIIGAAKSGTTALFKYLEQHPDVFMSDPKEPHYFAFEGQRPTFSGPGDDKTINRFAITERDAYESLSRDRRTSWHEAKHLFPTCTTRVLQVESGRRFRIQRSFV